mgnify:CR=1 FL=1
MEENKTQTEYIHPSNVSHTLDGYIKFIYEVEIYVNE